MTDPDGPHRGFSEIVSLPDEAIDLAQASLLIAREEYPGLRIGDYLARMDEMAASIRSRLRELAQHESVILAEATSLPRLHS